MTIEEYDLCNSILLAGDNVTKFVERETLNNEGIEEILKKFNMLKQNGKIILKKSNKNKAYYCLADESLLSLLRLKYSSSYNGFMKNVESCKYDRSFAENFLLIRFRKLLELLNDKNSGDLLEEKDIYREIGFVFNFKQFELFCENQLLSGTRNVRLRK